MLLPPAFGFGGNNMALYRWYGWLVLSGLLAAVGQPAAQAQDVQQVPWTALDDHARPSYQVLTTKTVQDMTVQGQAVKQTQEQTFYLKWTPGPKKERINGVGHWVVTQKIIGVKMVIEIGGNRIVHDSIEGNQAQGALSGFFE